MILRSFQPLHRIAALQTDGLLVGHWDHVPGGPVRDGYRAMVAAMRAAGVDTGDRPPIWAWRGRLCLVDAVMLLAEHELASGYGTVEFEAPPELVVESDYGAWNDHLCALVENAPTAWHVSSVPAGGELVQACLPHLRAEWVREVRPLPTSGWDELDPSQPV